MVVKRLQIRFRLRLISTKFTDKAFQAVFSLGDWLSLNSSNDHDRSITIKVEFLHQEKEVRESLTKIIALKMEFFWIPVGRFLDVRTASEGTLGIRYWKWSRLVIHSATVAGEYRFQYWTAGRNSWKGAPSSDWLVHTRAAAAAAAAVEQVGQVGGWQPWSGLRLATCKPVGPGWNPKRRGTRRLPISIFGCSFTFQWRPEPLDLRDFHFHFISSVQTQQKPSKTQFGLVKPSKTQWNPMKPI